ncbi:MAG TPA: primosomal protein N' [Candidatus Saccharimonadales bacterium]|nr:primosomal protein N' [Candidatus Saccharimonadales bacterium]
MHYYEVAPNQIIRSGSDTFTYSSDEKLDIGQIVLVEIGKKRIVGIVLSATTKPVYSTKSIISIIDPTPLPSELIDLSVWLSKYYLTPLAIVLRLIIPRGVQKKRRNKPYQQQIIKRDRTKIVFNHEQSSALEILTKNDSGTFLLQGVTGSGKTELYIEIAKKSISENKSVIILVPEIALTSQLISEFSNHFDNLLVTHSRMTESERHQIWSDAISSRTPRIAIGPRSALFVPLKTIGAIIVDEAHEPSYKQEQAPKYSALRAATMLGRFHNAKVILGSATPNIADRYLAEKSERPILKLNTVARIGSIPPEVTLVDMKDRSNFSNGHRFFSEQLVDQISKTLQINKQVLIFHNRRGSTSTTLCENCGWTAECKRCFLPLSLHADDHRLLCHICGYNEPIPTSCPTCGSVDIIHKGIGTKLIESELQKLFPDANIARFDADNSNDEAVNNRYDDLYKGIIDIAIGTQIVAKGLDLPQLRTVGVIQADTGLSLPDYNTNERTFQLLSQVIGRVGRNNKKTQVIVQTFQPTHPSIIYGLTQDYESFYKHALEERQRGLFPPYTYLLKLTCIYKTELSAIKNAKKIAHELRIKSHPDVRIMGPTPAFYERQHDTYRWQLVLKSPKREHLTNVLKFVPSKFWQFELDPTSLL